jgi:hypothetical protein
MMNLDGSSPDSPPQVISSVSIEHTPFNAVELPDGIVAITTLSKIIYLVDVTESNLSVRWASRQCPKDQLLIHY